MPAVNLKTMKKKCPKCLTNEGMRLILWGMPAEEPDPTKYYIGGCLVEDEMNKYKCITCNWEGN